jgi:hypothetical protein
MYSVVCQEGKKTFFSLASVGLAVKHARRASLVQSLEALWALALPTMRVYTRLHFVSSIFLPNFFTTFRENVRVFGQAIFLLTNCVRYGILEVRAAAVESGPAKLVQTN